jgi:hypothetical protein
LSNLSKNGCAFFSLLSRLDSTLETFAEGLASLRENQLMLECEGGLAAVELHSDVIAPEDIL